MEANYAGFADKVNAKTRTKYLAMTNATQRRAPGAKDFDTCTATLRKWVAWFNDRHLFIAVDKPSERHTTAPPSFRMVNTEVALLQIPSFDYTYATLLDSIVRANQHVLQKIPYLVIDLAGNGGGADDTYECLLPYVFSKPVRVDGVKLWASEDNCKQFEDIAKDTTHSTETRQSCAAIAAKMRKNMRTYVNADDSDSYVKSADTIYPFPKKVAILTDEMNASSAEQFLIETKQSSRVITFGTRHTSGTLDYSNLGIEYLPSGKRAVAIPTSRSNRLPQHPFDAYGFTPDVMIGVDVKDKIGFIVRYLKR